ncbi:uncharacterized protein F4822DRAFT_407714 [Hypoxylon trugodes]|uniref:uncharacterized protein n=1 Tax=Hypoxylon trugodes TaxID=326681 RepID=UPI0021928EC0|nr:uncharacterized protein F4822DRAFT_407714 [Hypoxylon trugodes]KAI1387825.1 hypothetical protein F4822DRAFT_407714 [Hypoxylon trugodes]
MARNSYAVLGVKKTSHARTIKIAYNKLARVKHSDKNPENPRAAEELQEVCLSLLLL